MNNYSVSIVPWREAKDLLMKIRYEVFVLEQNVPPEIEHDPLDCDYLHALALDNNDQPIGTGRLQDEGKIGRMAILKHWRGCGVGHELLNLLIEKARQRNLTEVKLSSQTHAKGFYSREGFVAFGEEHRQAGITHINMRKTLE